MKKILFDKSSFLLAAIFVVAAALLFFLMVLAYKHLEKQTESVEWMQQSYEISAKLQHIFSNLKDIETERRNVILRANHEEARKIINEKMIEITALENSLKQNFINYPVQQEHLQTLDMMIRYKYNIVNKTLSSLSREEDMETMKESLLAGKNVMASIQDKIGEMLEEEEILLNQRKDTLIDIQKSTPFYLFIISLFSLGMLVFAFYKMNKDVKTQKRNNDELKLALDTSQLAEKVGGYGIWIYDYTTKEYYFSDNEYRLLGYEPQAFQADHEKFFQHIHPEDRKRVDAKYHIMIETGSMIPFRYRIITKDGELRHFQMVGESVLSPSGERILLGITTDITSEVESQLKLEGTNWMLRERNKTLSIANETFEEAEKIGFFGTCQYLIDEDRFILSDNLFRLFGHELSDEDQFLKSFEEDIHPNDLKMVKMKISSVFIQKEITSFAFRIIRKNDRKLRYIDVSSKIIRDKEVGDYYLFIAQDATDEILDKLSIREKNRILEANNKELQAFNYVASHDLQEPLRKIETFISRLTDKDYDKLSDSGKQYLERIQLSSGRMRTLINDLLQFSRTTRAEQSYEVCDLNLLMNNALEELYHPIEEKRAQLEISNLPVLKVVPFQVQQLFTNLISNSLKYSKEGVKPYIKVDSEKVKSATEKLLSKAVPGNYYKITFSDNGIGFEQEYADKIFQLFHRLHGRGEFEGTGIGLAICKKIVENHKGYICAKGIPGEGSVFTIYFPEETKAFS